MVCECIAELLLCWSFACDAMPSIFTVNQNIDISFYYFNPLSLLPFKLKLLLHVVLFVMLDK